MAGRCLQTLRPCCVHPTEFFPGAKTCARRVRVRRDDDARVWLNVAQVDRSQHQLAFRAWYDERPHPGMRSPIWTCHNVMHHTLSICCTCLPYLPVFPNGGGYEQAAGGVFGLVLICRIGDIVSRRRLLAMVVCTPGCIAVQQDVRANLHTRRRG